MATILIDQYTAFKTMIAYKVGACPSFPIGERGADEDRALWEAQIRSDDVSGADSLRASGEQQRGKRQGTQPSHAELDWRCAIMPVCPQGRTPGSLNDRTAPCTPWTSAPRKLR
jgi:hypothetical protein